MIKVQNNNSNQIEKENIMNQKPTIEVLGKSTHELRCQVCPAGDEDVSVDPTTGICSVCNTEYDIVEVSIIVE